MCKNAFILDPTFLNLFLQHSIERKRKYKLPTYLLYMDIDKHIDKKKCLNKLFSPIPD